MLEVGTVTRLLQEADQGRAEAANQLYALVENDLRRIAHKRKREKDVGPGVDAPITALVNDAFCRLVGKDLTTWMPGDRKKFFGYVSVKVHDLLIDLLRKEDAAVRGGGWRRRDLDDDLPPGDAGPVGQFDLLLDLRAALARLEAFAAEDALLFRVRFFLECTFEETAEILGLSKSDAVRRYQRAQLWLCRELKAYAPDALKEHAHDA